MSRPPNEIIERFAFYLKQYPDVAIAMDGKRLRVDRLQLRETVYDLPKIKVGTRAISDLKLVIVEWKKTMPQSLHLCDEKGFSLQSMPLNFRTGGMNYTAYVHSSYVRELAESNELFMGDLADGVKSLTDAAKPKIKEFIRERLAEEAASLVSQWKQEGVYPYDQVATSPTETGERQVFDIVAYNVVKYAKNFNESDTKTKHLAFRLLRQTLETKPDAMAQILTEVLGLPLDKQKEFAELLERTSLSSLISAGKVIADRADLIRTLEVMLFQKEFSKSFLERTELQRILVDNTWMWGEQFHLAVDDQSLTEVLNEHLGILRKVKKTKEEKGQSVKRLDGKVGIIDMMLSKSISHRNGDDRHHLIVELKRPTQKLDTKVMTQVSEYALAVANDARTKTVPAKWSFWAISTEMDQAVRSFTRQKDKPEGVYHALAEQDITVYAKTWAEVLTECKGRMKFFQDQLNYRAETTTAFENVRKRYGQYFPKAVNEAMDMIALTNENKSTD